MKITSQKGQGLLEYALILSFIAAVGLVVFFKLGFRHAIVNVFDSASNNLAAVGSENESDDTSFDYENLTAEDIAPTYKTLNWQVINRDMQAMYGTVMNSDTVDKAIKSEINLFADLTTMSEGHLASTKAEDGIKDWVNFLATVEKSQSQSGFQSKYKRGEETFVIQRLGNSNTVQARYSDGKEVIYYRFSPDANNVMQIETNSDKSFRDFMTPMATRGGWEYDN